VIRDFNPDFQINPDPHTDICLIAAAIFWIYYLIGFSHFAKFRKNRQVTV